MQTQARGLSIHCATASGNGRFRAGIALQGSAGDQPPSASPVLNKSSLGYERLIGVLCWVS